MPLLIERTQTESEELRRVQDKIIAAVNPVLLHSILGGRIVESVGLGGGGVANDIAHGLGHKPIGWAIVRKHTVTEGPIARYRADAVQSIADATTYVTAQFNTKDEDTHNAVTTGAGWYFQAPMAGLYIVTAALLLDLSAIAQGVYTMEAWVRKNASPAYAGMATERYLMRDVSDKAGIPGWFGSAMVKLAKSDRIDVGVYQSTGAARNTYYDGINPSNTVAIVRLAEGPDVWDAQADLSDDFKSKFLRLKSQFNMTADIYVF